MIGVREVGRESEWGKRVGRLSEGEGVSGVRELGRVSGGE